MGPAPLRCASPSTGPAPLRCASRPPCHHRPMGSALVYVLVVGVVAGVIYVATALLAGRGEELEPMPPGATPTRLPARDLTGADLRELRFQQSFRGYRMSEVDWALDRLGARGG